MPQNYLKNLNQNKNYNITYLMMNSLFSLRDNIWVTDVYFKYSYLN